MNFKKNELESIQIVMRYFQDNKESFGDEKDDRFLTEQEMIASALIRIKSHILKEDLT